MPISISERVSLDNSELHEKVNDAVDEICDLYQSDDKPWVIGFSGGKDSTTLLNLVFRALYKLEESKRNKQIYVIFNDTLVESPYILDYIKKTLDTIRKHAHQANFPVSVHVATPEWDNTFFVNLIGKGYPAPNRWFRWCTEKIKINPTTKFIEQKVDQYGEVIILLGSRKAESASRAQVMSNYEIKGSILRRHATIRNALVYTPICEWSNDDVWNFLCTYPSSFSANNWELVHLYKNANGGECPLVIDNYTPSCGNNRFGCWVCTVVTKDKSTQGLIDSGIDELGPLLDFRDWLKEIRNNQDMRQNIRRNGTKGLGPFTLSTRKEILRRLIKIMKETGYKLVYDRELEMIQSFWLQDGAGKSEVKEIFLKERNGEKMNFDYIEENKKKENKLLEKVCKENKIEFSVIEKLIDVEKRMIGMQKRRGLMGSIDDVIQEEG